MDAGSETIAHANEAVERFHLLQRQAGIVPLSSTPLQSLDLYLIRQVIARLPFAPTVLDLASRASGGDSTIAIATHPRQVQVTAEESPGAPRIVESLQLFEVEPERVRFAPIQPVGQLATAAGDEGMLAPLIAVVAIDDCREVHDAILGLLDRLNPALVLIAPIGTVGESAALAECLRLSRDGTRYAFRLFRELSPFLAGSRLGILFANGDERVQAALRQIQQVFTGNYDFVGLLDREQQREIASHLQIDPATQREIDRMTMSTPLRSLIPTPIRHLYWFIVPLEMRKRIRERLQALRFYLRRL